MEGRLENGFMFLVLAVVFIVWGLLRFDARKRYKGAAELRGTVTGWNCFRGWKGSMERKYYEISVLTEKGPCTIRTNSGKAKKYRRKQDITVIVSELPGVWEKLARLSQNRMAPPSEWGYHYPQETGVLPAECRPRLWQCFALILLGAGFLLLSVLAFAGVIVF